VESTHGDAGKYTLVRMRSKNIFSLGKYAIPRNFELKNDYHDEKYNIVMQRSTD
jgi:hypothetical protein